MRAHLAVGLATAFLGILTPKPALAGTFTALVPTHAMTEFPTSTRVIVNGIAVYEGAPDLDDNSALVRLSRRLLQDSTEPARVIVRADFSESRQRIDFRVLDSTRALAAREVEDLESALEVE